jgi:hypothetical protein
MKIFSDPAQSWKSKTDLGLAVKLRLLSGPFDQSFNVYIREQGDTNGVVDLLPKYGLHLFATCTPHLSRVLIALNLFL